MWFEAYGVSSLNKNCNVLGGFGRHTHWWTYLVHLIVSPSLNIITMINSMGLCKLFFPWWHHRVSKCTIIWAFIYFCYHKTYIYYINIYFTVRKVNIFIILQISSISIASFQWNQSNFGKWLTSLSLYDKQRVWHKFPW